MRKGVMSAAVGAACLCITATAIGGAFAQDAGKNTSVVSGDCRTTGQKFLIATKPVAAPSALPFTALPESIAFTQRALGCVIVSYTAEAKAAATTTIQIRPILDGSQTSVPQFINLLSGNPGGGYSSQSTNFIFKNVAAGVRTLKFEFSGSGATYLQTRSIVISYMR